MYVTGRLVAMLKLSLRLRIPVLHDVCGGIHVLACATVCVTNAYHLLQTSSLLTTRLYKIIVLIACSEGNKWNDNNHSNKRNDGNQ